MRLPPPLALAATVVAAATLVASTAHAAGEAQGKKALYLNAYHQGYAWSDGIQTALLAKLQAAGVKVTTVQLDSKNHPEGLAAKVKEAKALLDSEKPDVVIVSDDNPVKHFVTPFLKDAATPVVFCGVNWDGAAHGLPYTNTTGMYEVALVSPLVHLLGKHAKGTRVGLLGGDNETSRADGLGIKKYCSQPALVEEYVKDVAGWKAAFLALQDKVDILIVRNDGLKGWSDAEMTKWVEENTRIPTGAIQEEVASLALASFAKLPSEQGQWAADAALTILRGMKPADIPPARNKKSKVILNERLAKKLGVTFAAEDRRDAEMIK
jgi:ABC-type uncharacterized transport system substrate-binding protein